MDEITGKIQRNGVNASAKEYDINRNVFGAKRDHKRKVMVYDRCA